MTHPAIQDVISVIGSAYLQPIADLTETLLARSISGEGPAGSGIHENGYSSALVVLLVALLESYTARVRFQRRSEAIAVNVSTPELLAKYFPDIPTKDELIEVFLIRNVIAHNHIWHLDVSDFDDAGTPTLATPQELGFRSNKHYHDIVDITTRKTHFLELNINPTSVDRTDVGKVFDTVWRTLNAMNASNSSHTPLAGSTVRFKGSRRAFGELIEEIKLASGEESL